MRRSALDRFFEHVRIHPDGCWEWTGRLWFWDGHPFMPSRWAYRYWVEEIPDGHRLTRLCALRHCVNPQHLEPSPRLREPDPQRRMVWVSIVSLALTMAGCTAVNIAHNSGPRSDKVRTTSAIPTVTRTKDIVRAVPPPSTPTRTALSTCSTMGYSTSPRYVGSLTPATVTGVVAGMHDCFDRLVFTFDGPASGYRVQYADQVLTQAQGAPLHIRGSAFLSVVLLNNSTVPSWATGTTDFSVIDPAGYAVLRDVVYGGSFEGHSTYGIGLTSRLPIRVFWVNDRTLVLDISHSG